MGATFAVNPKKYKTIEQTFSTDLKSWGNKALNHLKINAPFNPFSMKPHLRGSLKYKIYTNRQGVPYRLGFNFNRYGVFVEKGVGKGYKMVNGVVVKYGKGISMNPRLPNMWFNPTIRALLPELEAVVRKNVFDAVFNKIFIK